MTKKELHYVLLAFAKKGILEEIKKAHHDMLDIVTGYCGNEMRVWI